jgi:hypothetical protein
VLDKVLAVLSLGCLIGFMSFVVYYVAEPNLTIITVLVLCMAAYDFYRLTTVDKPKREIACRLGVVAPARRRSE